MVAIVRWRLMDLRPDPALSGFADEVHTWLEEHLAGEFGRYRGRGLTGQEDVPVAVQIAWERELASGGWLGLDFPEWVGGRGCTLAEQVVFFNTYTEARAPGRLPNMGVTLLGPTLMAFGSQQQQRRFVPPILAGDELWCQGYSEPGAGSDLARAATRADRRGDVWVINGQKVWTSLAQHADWIFVLARSTPGSRRHAGLSYLLVPMDQPGIEVRPITQLTGGVEFNETFFDDAVTAADLVVGGEGNGWKVAMGTLAFERGGEHAGPADQLPPGVRCPGARGSVVGADRLRCAALGAGAVPHRVGDPALQPHAPADLAHSRCARRPGAVHRQAVLGLVAPAPGRAGHEGEGRSRDGRRSGLRRPHRRGWARLSTRPLAAHVPLLSGPHHLRGKQRDTT